MDISVEKIMKLRLTVARFGEMDRAKWWNTNGMLANLGELAISRGLPKTHLFARARAVFAVAGHRCDEIYNAPGAYTLWKLPAEIEDQLEDAWPGWLEKQEPWHEFLGALNEQTSANLLEVLQGLNLADDRVVEQVGRLQRANDMRSVPLSKELKLDETTIGLLSAAFSRGEPGKLAVPYLLSKGASV